jgi:hypothetical protein
MLYAVTVTHPWAVMFPVKDTENREREPSANLEYLAIRAGRTPSDPMLPGVLEEARYLRDEVLPRGIKGATTYPRVCDAVALQRLRDQVVAALESERFEALYPLSSAIVGVMRVNDVQPPIHLEDERQSPWHALGQFSVFGETTMLETPVPCRGGRGFWTPDRSTLNAMLEQWRITRRAQGLALR